MGNTSTHLVNVRAAGTTNKATGVSCGGAYYYAHEKNGKIVPARWVGTLIWNGRDWTDSEGNIHKGDVNSIQVVVWNSKNSKPGRGMADIFAKNVSVGKSLSLRAEIKSFKKRIFINGQPVLHNGEVVTYDAQNLIFKDSLEFGADSAKVIRAETSAWNGSMDFSSRPPFWNVEGHADQLIWKQIMKARKEAVYTPGSDLYGYASVIRVEGVNEIDPVSGNIVAGNQTTNSVDQNAIAAAMALLQQQQQTGQVKTNVDPLEAAAILQAQLQAGSTNNTTAVMGNTAGI